MTDNFVKDISAIKGRRRVCKTGISLFLF